MAKKRKSRAIQTFEAARNMRELPRSGAPRLEFNGNSELMIEGCKGVVAYGEDEIRLDLGELTLAVTGADLTMRALQLEECSVTGQIASVSFFSF